MAVRQGHGAWRFPSNGGLLSPFERFLRTVFKPQAPRLRRTASSGEELRRLRAERGVGRPPRILAARAAKAAATLHGNA